MKHHKSLIPALGLPVSMHLCAQTSIGSDGWEQAQFELVSSHWRLAYRKPEWRGQVAVSRHPHAGRSHVRGHARIR